MSTPVVHTGLDRLVARSFAPLRGARTGLVVHPASVDRTLAHAARLFAAAPEVGLRACFGPQHGIRGETQDNMIEWSGFTDPATGLPVYSLYGEHRKPTPAMLESLDVLVVDLQDVGARYYTFVWTMLLCMEACAEAGVKVMVLDRPNPIGGAAREGNVLDPAYRSFVGMAPIPMRHGLTLGELARYLRARFVPGADLEVVAMEGWRRGMAFEETGLPWVLPSPNMPTVDTAFVYPGFCLLEGTQVSEGRGTTRPFEIFGAPYVDPDRLVARLAEFAVPGVAFRPLYFEPTFQKHARVLCGGAQQHVTDRAAYRSTLAAAAVLVALRELWPRDFAWKEPPYEYETVKLPIDILAGGPALREAVDSGRSPHEIEAAWADGLLAFESEIAEYLLYA